MPFGIQPLHIVIIVAVALLIFGPKRLPELGRYIGKTLTEFRHGTQELAEGLREEVNRPLPATPHSPSAASGNYCAQCGSSNTAGARFCGSCGAGLAEKTT